MYGMYSKVNLNHLLYIGKLESVMSLNIRDSVHCENVQGDHRQVWNDSYQFKNLFTICQRL